VAGVVRITIWSGKGASSSLSHDRYLLPPSSLSTDRHPDAVWLYLRFTLSYCDVEELLAERGLDVSYETVRSWVLKFGPIIARRLRRLRPRPSNRWHLDGVSRTHLWRMKVWSCTRDEGGPLDAGGQAQASNHCKLLSSKAMVVSVAAKGGT